MPIVEIERSLCIMLRGGLLDRSTTETHDFCVMVYLCFKAVFIVATHVLYLTSKE